VLLLWRLFSGHDEPPELPLLGVVDVDTDVDADVSHDDFSGCIPLLMCSYDGEEALRLLDKEWYEVGLVFLELSAEALCCEKMTQAWLEIGMVVSAFKGTEIAESAEDTPDWWRNE